MPHAALHIAIASPTSEVAHACLSAYYAELNARFDGGFDVSLAHNESLDSLEQPNGWFLIAQLDGQIVACTGLRRLDATTGELKRMWVSPLARGRGVARAMLRRVEEIARSAGFREIRMDSNQALIEAHTLYRATGYRDIAPYNNNPCAHVWFAKTL